MENLDCSLVTFVAQTKDRLRLRHCYGLDEIEWSLSHSSESRLCSCVQVTVQHAKSFTLLKSSNWLSFKFRVTSFWQRSSAPSPSEILKFSNEVRTDLEEPK